MDARDTVFLVILVFWGKVLSVNGENGGTYFEIDVKYSDAYCSDEAHVHSDVRSDLFCAYRCSGTEGCKGFFYNNITNVCSTVNTVLEDANECQAQSGSLFYMYKLLDCGAAPVVDNSVLQSTVGATTPGTVLTYSCEHGYGSPTNKNNYTVACQNSGNSTDVRFECKKDCSEPSAMDYATLDDGLTLEGTMRTHTCLENYRTLSGSAKVSVTCTNTGEWTLPAEICYGTCKSSHALVTGPKGISNEKISATSFHDYLRHQPWYGRLDNDSSWLAASHTSQQHIQFEFASAMIVNEIITQGCVEYTRWVITYKIAYSTDCGNFTEYNKVFNGNGDINDKVSNEIIPTITARCVRVLPLTYNVYIGLRVELMGCSP